jgi:hypothetical protein
LNCTAVRLREREIKREIRGGSRPSCGVKSERKRGQEEKKKGDALCQSVAAKDKEEKFRFSSYLSVSEGMGICV